MKKIGKKLSYFMKVFLAVGLLFNNLSSVAVVLAEEINGDVVINENQNDDDELNEAGGSDEGKENIGNNDENTGDNATNDEKPTSDDNTVNDETTGDETTTSGSTETGEGNTTSETPNEGGETPNLDNQQDDTLEFTVTYSETDEGIIIKYSKATELAEGTVIGVRENFEYVDGTNYIDSYGDTYEEIELTADDLTLLAGDGYLYFSPIVMTNEFSGTYSFEATILDETRSLTKSFTVESGYILSLYDGDTLLEPTDGVYVVPKDLEKIDVRVRALPGGLTPHTHYTIGDINYTAYGLIYDDQPIGEIELSGYLHGKFTYNFEEMLNRDDTQDQLSASFTIQYGEAKDDTDLLNESAKNVGLDGKYAFLWLTDEGKIYIG